MSRKDTIIVAILMNAGLLAILFATAWNTQSEPASGSIRNNAILAEQELPPLSSKGDRDEIDQVLKRYAAAQQAHSQTGAEVPAPQSQAPKKENHPLKTSNEKDSIMVTVKRGDYLEKIARSNGTTIDTLIVLNKLENTRLQIGQQLRVPKSSPKSTSEHSQSSQKTTTDSSVYIVQAGDSPWSIARRHGLDLDQLLRLNDLNEEKARNIRAGDRLKFR
jgi:peptidoglycan endopeptidase LytF